MRPRPQPERRSALLASCTDYLLAHGLAGLALRPMAEAVGTSPRMLIYHVTSKDHLVVEMLHEARRRQRAAQRSDTARGSVSGTTPV